MQNKSSILSRWKSTIPRWPLPAPTIDSCSGSVPSQGVSDHFIEFQNINKPYFSREEVII